MAYIDPMMDAIDAELQVFQWAYPGRSENRGEISVDRETKELVLEVWCRDNESDDEELKPLVVRKRIFTDQEPRQQIRQIIHDYLCHEADEQIWFENFRPYYPH